MSTEIVTPASFRLATYTLELIERRKFSLDRAFQEALRKVRRPAPDEVRASYELTLTSLYSFAAADFALEQEGLAGIPLRRKCAFRVAFAAIKERLLTERNLDFVKGGLLAGRLLSLLKERRVERVLELVEEIEDPTQRIAITHSCPPWIVEELAKQLGLSRAERIVRALKTRRVWVRVNLLRAEPEEVEERLRRCGYRVRRDKELPYLLEVVNPDFRLSRCPVFRRGLAVIHDKGSALIVEALGVLEEDIIADLAAAPGIKASLAQQIRRDSGYLVALDISYARMRSMRSLVRGQGIKMLDMVVADSRTLPLRTSKFDKVLLDSPCTNSGAIPQDPGLRLALWRRPALERYVETQEALISHALNALKPGGRLVYSVCSLSYAEGEGHFEKMEEWLVPPGPRFEKCYPSFPDPKLAGRLFPDVHGTIGYFIAIMEKPC